MTSKTYPLYGVERINNGQVAFDCPCGKRHLHGIPVGDAEEHVPQHRVGHRGDGGRLHPLGYFTHLPYDRK